MTDRSRWRVTIRASNTELRGYVDGVEAVEALARSLQPEGWLVIASPATPDYNPFVVGE